MSETKFVCEIRKEIKYLNNTGHSHTATLMEALLEKYIENLEEVESDRNHEEENYR